MRRWSVAAVLVSSGIAAAAPMPGIPEGDPAGRRAVRGVTVPEVESAELSALRQFEADRFGRARRRWMGDEGLGRELPSPPARYRQLALPDVAVRWDERVVRYLDFYKDERRGRAIIGSWLRLQGRYRERIEEALRAHGLPQALLYVAMIESGYDPLDKSSAGAAGLWQFMPAGGRIYGLRIDHWVDERNDPDKATAAVMRYFEDLHARFGSWHLALAAFNAGYGAVLASVQKYNTNDYWALSRFEDGLPFETVQYVPKMLAVAIVGENRAAFGQGDVVPLPALEVDRVDVAESASVETIARAAGVPAAEVASLNPELRRGRTPPERWTVKLPRGSGPRFVIGYPRLVERLTIHRLRAGERLEQIARACKTSVKELRRLNGIRDLAELRPGTMLCVPSPHGVPPKIEADPETGTTIVALPDADAAAGTPGAADRKRVFYRVAPGDGLGEIAGLLGVTDAEMATWNRIDPDAHLVAGMILQAWVDPSADLGLATLDPAHLALVTAGSEGFFDSVEARRGRKRIQYEVRRGDTFASIAARYHLGLGDLERINCMGRGSDLFVGQKLTIYVPITPAMGPRDSEAATRLPRAPALGESDATAALPTLRDAAPASAVPAKVITDDTPASAPPYGAACEDPALPLTWQPRDSEPSPQPEIPHGHASVTRPLARAR